MKTLLGLSIWFICTLPAALAADLPSNKKPCNPNVALGQRMVDATHKVADLAPNNIKANDEVLAILKKYPNAGNKQPIKDFLNADDSARVAVLFSRIARLNLYTLAEERLGRDAHVMANMLRESQLDRDGKTDISARALARLKADEARMPRSGDMKEAVPVYVALLRLKFKDAKGLAEPENRVACSIDLALWMESERAFQEFKRYIESDEPRELMRLREKYQVSQGESLDTSKMPAAEARYAAEIQKSVSTKIASQQAYQTDLENLRRLALMSKLKYDLQHEQLVRLGGEADKDAVAAMGVMDDAKFKELSEDEKFVWNLWKRMDAELPTSRVQALRQKSQLR